MKIEFQVGRPSGLTEDVAERILSNVESGFNLSQIARISRVPHNTLSCWLKRGKEDQEKDEDSIYAQFVTNYECKKGLAIQDLLFRLKSQDSYQSISWLLENCFPEEYGKNSDLIKDVLSNINLLSRTLNSGDALANNFRKEVTQQID